MRKRKLEKHSRPIHQTTIAFIPANPWPGCSDIDLRLENERRTEQWQKEVDCAEEKTGKYSGERPSRRNEST